VTISGFEGKSTLRRLALGASGQAFSRVMMALTAVVWPSLMLRAWGVGGYGEWVALTSVAAVLGLSDFGFVTPSVNEIVMTAGSGDLSAARSRLRRAISFVFLFVTPALLALALALAAIDYRSWFHFHVIDNPACVVVIAASVFGLLSRTFRGLFVAVLYANGDYGIAYACAGAVRSLELVVVAALLCVRAPPPTDIAIASAAIAALDLAAIMVLAARRVAWTSFAPERLDWAWLKRMIRPAFGFALANMGTQMVLIMGARIALGLVSGAPAVAIYALYGAMMRLVDQCVLTFLMPLEVEMAHSAGAGDLARTARLVRAGNHASRLVFAAIAAGLAIAGPFVFPIWTQGRVPFHYGVFALACLMSGSGQLGRVCAHALIATNRMYGPSFRMIVWAIVAVALGAALASRMGARGMLWGGVVGELGLSLIVTHAVSRWLKLPIAGLLLDPFSLRAGARSFLSHAPRWRGAR
jgi:hypothetical protein